VRLHASTAKARRHRPGAHSAFLRFGVEQNSRGPLSGKGACTGWRILAAMQTDTSVAEQALNSLLPRGAFAVVLGCLLGTAAARVLISVSTYWGVGEPLWAHAAGAAVGSYFAARLAAAMKGGSFAILVSVAGVGILAPPLPVLPGGSWMLSAASAAGAVFGVVVAFLVSAKAQNRIDV
jgi:hypothetical protein